MNNGLKVLDYAAFTLPNQMLKSVKPAAEQVSKEALKVIDDAAMLQPSLVGKSNEFIQEKKAMQVGKKISIKDKLEWLSHMATRKHIINSGELELRRQLPEDVSAKYSEAKRLWTAKMSEINNDALTKDYKQYVRTGKPSDAIVQYEKLEPQINDEFNIAFAQIKMDHPNSANLLDKIESLSSERPTFKDHVSVILDIIFKK